MFCLLSQRSSTILTWIATLPLNTIEGIGCHGLIITYRFISHIGIMSGIYYFVFISQFEHSYLVSYEQRSSFIHNSSIMTIILYYACFTSLFIPIYYILLIRKQLITVPASNNRTLIDMIKLGTLNSITEMQQFGFGFPEKEWLRAFWQCDDSYLNFESLELIFRKLHYFADGNRYYHFTNDKNCYSPQNRLQMLATCTNEHPNSLTVNEMIYQSYHIDSITRRCVRYLVNLGADIDSIPSTKTDDIITTEDVDNSDSHNPNSKVERSPAIALAVMRNNASAFLWLAQNGARMTESLFWDICQMQPSSSGDTMLKSLFANSDRNDIETWLIKSNNSDGFNAMTVLAGKGNADAILTCLDLYRENMGLTVTDKLVNSQSANGWTPLTYAASTLTTEDTFTDIENVIQLLLFYGASVHLPSQKPKEPQTALNVAIENSSASIYRNNIITALNDGGAQLNGLKSPFMEASARENDTHDEYIHFYETFVLQRDNALHLNETDKNGFTALTWCAKYGLLSTMKYLINEIGCNVNELNSDGQSPLIVALSNMQINIVNYLCDEKQRDINVKIQCKNIHGIQSALSADLESWNDAWRNVSQQARDQIKGAIRACKGNVNQILSKRSQDIAHDLEMLL